MPPLTLAPSKGGITNLQVDNLVVMNLTNTDVTDVLEVDILIVNTTTLNGPLTCTDMGSINGTCIDSISQDQVTCSTPLENTCFPSVWDTLNVSGTVTSNTIESGSINTTTLDVMGQTTLSNTSLTGPVTCSGDGLIAGTCVDQILSSQLVCDVPFDCLPVNATFDSLTVDNLVVNNMTQVDIDFQQMLEVDHLVVNQTTLNGELTCEGDGSIEPDCVDISNKACPGGDLDASCIPDIPSSTVTCDVPLADACVDISMKSCTSPVNANCVDISGETCMQPIQNTCLPTIDGVMYSAGPAPNIDLLEGPGVTITPNPGANSITISASVNASITCDDPALDLDCLSDVTIDTTPNDGDVLKYNGTSGQWEPTNEVVPGCPNFHVVSGRFLGDGTEAPASDAWSVDKLDSKTFNITYTVPFAAIPFVMITTEKDTAPSSASIKTGQSFMTHVTIISTSTVDAINFRALSC